MQHHHHRSASQNSRDGKSRKSRSFRVAAFVLGFVLAASVGAAAAWILYSGLSGSAGSKIQGTSTLGALTVTPDYANSIALAPGDSGVNGVWNVHNASPNSVMINDDVVAGPVVSSPDASCASYITYNPSNISAQSYAPGDTHMTDHTGKWSASASLPISCANDTLSVTLTATTTP